jgi:nicotinamidase/pyrazinamidase
MNALLLVDLQNDFMPQGALAVAGGDQVVPIANRMADSKRFDLVLATQDWHPPNHGSFAANHPGRKPGDIIDLDGIAQILWPVHCVQGTRGAEFAPGFRTDRVERVFQKGTDPRIDSYSAFFDNAHRKSTGLGEFLRERGVVDVFILGLATDYCVRYSVLDARHLGFSVIVLTDACRAVNVHAGDDERALATMREAGAAAMTTAEFLRKVQRL